MALTTSARRRFKAEVLDALTRCLADSGWQRAELDGWAVFSRPLAVSPYFLYADVSGRRWGSYVVTGAIGVLHRAFEEAWCTAHPGEADPALGLHTANFMALHPACSLQPDQPMEPQIRSYCTALLEVLSAFPSDEQSLITALDQDRLGDRRLGAYASVRFPHKTRALETYLRERRTL